MVRIRFRRVGARNQASFRIVAADKESPRDGRFLEVLGSYNPRTNPSTVIVDEARLFHWMSNGAQPSDSVVQTLQTGGTWERWERFKSGESLDTLIQEAEAAIPEIDPRTRRDDQIGQRSKKRRRHPDAVAEPTKPEAKAAETAEADAPETADAEAAETVEDDAVETVEADAPETAEAEGVETAEAEAEPEAEVETEASQGESAESSADEDDEAEEEPEGDADAEPAEAHAEPAPDPQGGE